MSKLHPGAAALALLASSALFGCSEDPSQGAPADSGATSDTVATADSHAPDAATSDTAAAPAPLPGATCPPFVMDPGETTPSGDCAVAATEPDGTRKLTVRADCTDPNITALVDKRHLVMVPPSVTRDVLWLHLPGTGGKPENSEEIGRVATGAGYRYVSLAYPNAQSVGRRCACPEGPRPIDCEELVRAEVLYGDDVTDYFDMEADEAIVPRLLALLAYLHQRRPDDGWDSYVDNGAPRWSKIAVSGFSQGGGFAGFIARDHAVDRTLYLSTGAGSVLAAMVSGDAVQPCGSRDACGGAPCCPLSQLSCESAEAPGPDAYCVVRLPDPWTAHGADVDGDRRGDGDPSTRATAPDRQFATIHREEGAWEYSPEAFVRWGMISDRDAIVDVDETAPEDYGAAQVFSTAQEPNLPSCSPHQAMGADACHPIDPQTGEPVMAPAWRHAITAPLPPL